MAQKLAIAGSIAAVVSAFFPIYLHFSGSSDSAAAPPPAASAVAPGFDCAKASTATEATICANETLARLDLTLNARYDALVLTMEEDKLEDLESSQGAWIRKRDACRTKVPCIQSQYMVRLETFRELKK